MNRNRKPHRAVKDGAFDWAKQQRLDVEFAKGILLAHGELAPMFVVHTPDKIEVLLAPPWRDRDEKFPFYNLLKLRAAADGAIGMTFITEAWMRDVPLVAGETEAEHRVRAQAVPPSEAEDRMEVVMVMTTYRDADGKQDLTATLDIVRNAAGKVIAAPERKSLPGTFQGPVRDILLDEPVPEHLRPQVREMYERAAKQCGFKTSAQVIHPAGHA